MLGNILQQCYNIADTLIVGRYVGNDALAAVGASYTLMIFLTSIILGLSMGAGAFISMEFGKKDYDRMKNGIVLAFVLIGGITLLITFAFFAGINNIIKFLQIPSEIIRLTKQYLIIIGIGIIATFFYNFFGNGLRAIGNSLMPLIYLGISAVLNIVLDLFIVKFNLGVAGAAEATVISQYVSGMGITIYALLKSTHFRIKLKHLKFDMNIVKELANLSILTALQQSVMNFGILLVQGLVNSFGTVVMAAFAAAVKIDTLAYSPVQDFGNAVSTFVAQNYGAGKKERIFKSVRICLAMAVAVCGGIVLFLAIFCRPLFSIFTTDQNVINIGIDMLRFMAPCYTIYVFIEVLSGALRGTGDVLLPTLITLGGVCLIRIPWIMFVLPAHHTTTCVMLSYPISWITTTALIIPYYLYRKKHAYD